MNEIEKNKKELEEMVSNEATDTENIPPQFPGDLWGETEWQLHHN